MPLTMFDSTTVDDLPDGGDAYAGYVDGNWPNFAEVQARFPDKPCLDIAVSTRTDATCFDLEPGNPTPERAGPWAVRQIDRGVWRPVLYFPASWGIRIISSLSEAGLARDQYRLWSAHWTYQPHICDPSCGYGFSADGTQWTNPPKSGGHYDVSLLNDDFFGSVFEPNIPAPEEADMYLIDNTVDVPEGDPSRGIWLLTGNGYKRHLSPEMVGAYGAAGVLPKNLTAAQVAHIPDEPTATPIGSLKVAGTLRVN